MFCRPTFVARQHGPRAARVARPLQRATFPLLLAGILTCLAPRSAAANTPVNVAAAHNGSTATASSFYGAGFPSHAAIDGNRGGAPWGAGGGWNDATPDVWGDALEIAFHEAHTIDRVIVYSLQDAFASPVDPSPFMTFTLYGLTGFEVQYWSGSQWLTAPGGAVAGNTLVKREVTFPALTTTAIRIVVTSGLASYSRIVEVEAFAPPGASINAAAAANGGVASASSSYSAGFLPGAAIDGNRRGEGWGSGGGWNDGTFAQHPDWLQVAFPAARPIGEVIVITLQDAYWAPVEPSASLTFSSYGATHFEVQYSSGTSWLTVPGGAISNNTLVRRRVTFTPVTTTAIRILITGALASWSRLVEVEAYTVAAAPGTFTKSAPSHSTMGLASTPVLTWSPSLGATSYELCVEPTIDNTCGSGWVDVGNVTAASLTPISSSTSYQWQVRARNPAGVTVANGGAWWMFTSAPPGARINVASAGNGATATASSFYSSGFLPGAAIDGNRLGDPWGNGGGWNDGTFNQWNDWWQVTFSTAQSIGEVVVFSLQDAYWAPVDPSPSKIFSSYGLTDFQIQYWSGSQWITVPQGVISGNTLVRRSVTFPEVTTTAIRIVVTGALAAWSRLVEFEAYPPATVAPAYRLTGLGFSPYMDGQSPHVGSVISAAQSYARLQSIAPYTHWVRTFGSTHGLELIPSIARGFGKYVAAGAWIDSNLAQNAIQIANLIANAQAGLVDVAIVGSEALLRGDVSEAQLLAYINQVRQAVPAQVLVGTADTYNVLLAHPSIIAASDILLPNIYGYWQGLALSNAVCALDAAYNQLAAVSGGKPIWISESGWPSDGPAFGAAVPSLANANAYFLQFVSWARMRNVPYLYFEAFDEAWKSESGVGPHWGVWDTQAVLKPGMQPVFDNQTTPISCIPGGPGAPALNFTSVPPYGSAEILLGTALHVLPADHKVVVYIKVGSNWWVKPTFAAPLTSIFWDGTWSTQIVTGGTDQFATEIAAFLIPNSYTPPTSGSFNTLPSELYTNALATAQITRAP